MATGWTFAYIATLDLWDVKDLQRRWAVYPPLHMLEAAKLGLNTSHKKATVSPATLAAFGG